MKGTQIDMKKKRFATIVAALLVISLASCSTPAGSLPSAPDGSHVPEKTQALYSNLTDDSSRREVVDALQAHGVSQEQTDTLLAWADDFNARVTTPTLTEGFTATPNQVFTREQLLDHIWGYEYIGDTRTVDVHVKRLREKIKDNDSWSLSTVWGIGYKFEVKNI